MCGIAGLIKFESDDKLNSSEVVHEMMSALIHRGPDGEGYWEEGHVALGHRRLSIIDLENGQQPILSESGRQVLVYNGETYNFESLRASLESNHQFKTASDSEVLVHLYEEYGALFSDKLNGIFAYAIWDGDSQTLNLGIDAFGVKPLYYYVGEKYFLFTSELPSLVLGLRKINDVTIRADHDAVDSYLRLGWIPAPHTIVKGVRKLAPGERLEITKNGTVNNVPSIKLQVSEEEVEYSEKECLLELKKQLRSSVKSQLVSDVPIGILLSGGVDSSIVTALASSESEHIKTFSVGFAGDGDEVSRMDESHFAKQVSNYYGTEHFELKVDSAMLLEHIDESLALTGEPIADPAVLPLLMVTRFASQHVKVCLCGDGGDEMFGGYVRFMVHPYKQWFHRLPEWLRNVVGFASRSLPKKPRSGILEKLRKIRVALDFLLNDSYNIGPFSGRQSAWLMRKKRKMKERGHYPLCLNELGECEILEQLPGQLLVKSDRVGMSSSLELRVPFLTQSILSFSSSLPREMKLKGSVTKYILRKLVEELLPSAIANRPKQGFRMPMSGWFKNELAEYVWKSLGGVNPYLDKYISQTSREKLIKEHLSGDDEHSIRIWSLLALDCSMKKYFNDRSDV